MLLINSLLTITIGSFLLFLIQPIVGKQLLPFFGGVPAVWNTCLVFFQGMLLISYFYVYANTHFLKSKQQYGIHLLLIGLSILWLPFLSYNNIHTNVNYPTLSVLEILFRKMALPLFILGTTSTLIQVWFSKCDNKHAKDPYFLYSASNFGGLIALISFPFLLEPLFGLKQIFSIWIIFYLLFCASFLLTIIYSYKNSNHSIQFISQQSLYSPINFNQRLEWVLLSFAPACLLVGVTQYITTDLASAPLLWILPLIIYLITFIIAFSKQPLISHNWMLRNQPLFLVFPLIVLAKKTIFAINNFEMILFPLIGFFALTLVCQGQLVVKRPDKKFLSEFYLWIALGGFLGSVFASLIAPLLFKGIYEYFIAFCLCVALRPWPKDSWQASDLLFPIAIAILLYIIKIVSIDLISYKVKYLSLIAIITLILMYHQRPFRFAVSLGVFFCYVLLSPLVNNGQVLWEHRNFFGVTRVLNNPKTNLHILVNGTTIHGMQSYSQKNNLTQAESYYSPMHAISSLINNKSSNPQVGLVGLGTGTLSCIFRNDKVTYFEIDPAIVNLASNPKLFSYISNCPPQKIILGDARLNLEKSLPHFYQVILIDAFSSDAIPIHLTTKEALQLYISKLTYNGLLVFHISSHYVDLDSVLASLSKELNLHAFVVSSKTNSKSELNFESKWIVMTPSKTVSEDIQTKFGWSVLKSNHHENWTDDFSTVLKILRI